MTHQREHRPGGVRRLSGSPGALSCAAALLALAVALPSARPVQAPESPPRTPGPPEVVGGVKGFFSRSRLTFFAAPEDAHELEVVHLFPGRTHWMLSFGSLRTLHYRFGEEVHSLSPGTAASRHLTGEEHRNVLRQIELRKALMLWPDGFEWAGEGNHRSCEIGDLGRLEAALGDDGRPVEMVLITAEEVPLLSVDSLEWRRQGARTWPAGLVFRAEGQPVWREEIETVDTGVAYLDVFFLPPDLRDPDRGTPVTAARTVQHVDLPARAVWRRALEQPTTWERALAAADALAEAERERVKARGLAPEESHAIETSPEGHPSACLLRLPGIPEELPAGWVAEPAGPALSLTLFGTESLGPHSLDALLEQVPPGGRPGRPYANVRELEGGRTAVQLVLPLLPKE